MSVQPTEALSPAGAQALAERVAAAMFARDQASQHLGIAIASVGPGRAELQMTVRAHMLNGHAICHGGFIFTLADSTFAFACNSRNLTTVASGCTIDFLAPAREGDVLTARATTLMSRMPRVARSPCSVARATASPATSWKSEGQTPIFYERGRRKSKATTP
jgi:acyl-CoA thioesterase